MRTKVLAYVFTVATLLAAHGAAVRSSSALGHGQPGAGGPLPANRINSWCPPTTVRGDHRILIRCHRQGFQDRRPGPGGRR